MRKRFKRSNTKRFNYKLKKFKIRYKMFFFLINSLKNIKKIKTFISILQFELIALILNLISFLSPKLQRFFRSCGETVTVTLPLPLYPYRSRNGNDNDSRPFLDRPFWVDLYGLGQPVDFQDNPPGRLRTLPFP